MSNLIFQQVSGTDQLWLERLRWPACGLLIVACSLVPISQVAAQQPRNSDGADARARRQSPTEREAQWIWSPEHPRGQAPAGDCYFRKTIQVGSVEQATVTITADDSYELFVNGRKAGEGGSIRQMEQHEISRLLGRGRNVIAVRATNAAAGPAALAARVLVKPVDGQWRSYSTDASWRTELDAIPNWHSAQLNDRRWKPARVFGVLGKTSPWDRREGSSPSRISENQRFQISSEFAVDEILDNDQTGSLVNIAFNEFGHLIAAREGGPLLLIYDSDNDGVVDKTRDYCDLVENIQGILPLNGDVYVTGNGREGNGIYRLVDHNRDGKLEEAVKIIGFTGEPGEHGAHGLTLGPDGRIYCVLGNHVSFDGEYAESSPLRNFYEGDVVGPRYEDPGGHARGIKAPGGTVIRLDLKGETIELVAGGLRNAFDLAFHTSGRLFVHDSDMESDEGAVWYRPTSLYEISEAAEFGWRSGWAKWPSYFFDRLPTTLETGRGSPTGACTYSHIMFPQRYHDTLFLADWTKGQILNVSIDEAGDAQSEVFLQGQPLNVTDLAVGPDGWLYFCTGGRGTKGGVYQVRWRGQVPAEVTDRGDGIARAIKQPQLTSAWARQEVASLKRELSSSWNDTVAGVAFSDSNSAKYRLRALDLMQLFGPVPTPELLTALSQAPNEAVRARAAYLMGLHSDSDEVAEQLFELLQDRDRNVQQAACEGLLRCGRTPDFKLLVPLLEESYRRLSWGARRLLERIPSAKWKDELLGHDKIRIQLQAGLALIISEPTEEHGLAVCNMVNEMLEGFVSDRDLMDLLRLTQVTLHRCELGAEQVPELAETMIEEFPIGEPALNRELFRILARLNGDEVVPRAIRYLQADSPLADRLHIALHLRFFEHEWTAAERYSVVKFFEEATLASAGSSVPLYVMNVTRDLCRDLPMAEARIFVSEGAKWPNAALVSMYQYPQKLEPADLEALIQLDREIDRPGFEAERYKRLRTGIVALLSQHADETALDYLRQIWVRSPERRQAVALGLCQFPTDENWDYLVRSLPVLESFAVAEVLNALKKIPNATDDPQALRAVILHGLRMDQDGQSAASALRLLTYWTGVDFPEAEGQLQVLSNWQEWYAEEYPDRPAAALPVAEEGTQWNLETISEYFATSDGRNGNSQRGAEVFDSAKCRACHRMGDVGTAIGPDLTNVANRFTRKEVLESILFPSHVISDQYRTHRVLTVEGQVHVGSVTENADGSITVRDSELNETIVSDQNVEQMLLSQKSLMPSGLLDEFPLSDIRDLMTFMGFVPDRASGSQVAEESGKIKR